MILRVQHRGIRRKSFFMADVKTSNDVRIRDLRRKQFFLMDDEYLNGYAQLCGIVATGVYMSLCRHVNKSQKCWPSLSLIQEELAIGSHHTVVKAVRELETWGIIRVIRAKDSSTKRQKPNVYELIDKSEWIKKPMAPSAPGADGISSTKPMAFDVQKPMAPDALEGNTNKKGTQEEGRGELSFATPANEAKRFFESDEQRAEVIDFLVGKGLPFEVASTEVAKFVSYWTEPNKTGKKTRWQMEKTFEVRRRLFTWLSRIRGFNSRETKGIDL